MSREARATIPSPITGPHVTTETRRIRFWLKAIVLTMIACTFTVVFSAYYLLQ